LLAHGSVVDDGIDDGIDNDAYNTNGIENIENAIGNMRK
jgi:hypothetical protein